MDETTSNLIPPATAQQPMSHMLNGRYELFDDLGGSDLAHVFRAWDHQLQHAVAIKVLDQRFGSDEKTVEEFERAARFLASLPAHPNIVSVTEVGRDDKIPYFVMQFINGQNLKDLIAREAPLPIDRAFRLCRQMAEGLAFAHQYGLVHGDVKPQNAVISAQDQVKLMDFGITRAEEQTAATPTALVVVRAQYLSPEQALGRSAEASSDIYSLGVVLFEMLTGQLPFRAEAPLETAKKHVLEQPPDPHLLNPAGVSPAAAEIVLKALSKESPDRFRSAAAFAAALHEHLLVEKGDTPKYFEVPDTKQRDKPSSTQAVEEPPATQAKPPTPSASTSRSKPIPDPRKKSAAQPSSVLLQLTRAIPVLQAGPRSTRTRRLTFTSLLYVATVAIAATGGWVAYRAIDKAFSGLGTNPGPVHRAYASGCPVQHVGPVRLLQVWSEQLRAVPGRPITVDYKIANDAAQCRDAFLSLTAFSNTSGRMMRDPSRGKVIGAQPGIHVYKRWFIFPARATGQSFDLEWTVKNPTRTRIYASVRLRHVITVVAR